ncbi:hypothetical protein BDV95DRAFT_639960 [Massariosphaeria phaeospora]|uniref:Uncharacterized protein n=1 Tax=Massariosphaeria phaeospora TaxID=100035 RepID=A0A7C8I451_9PLEO|nr:hypothetical protein BDV95DRAFT_639960 [Massariosphaeria phaeospora]
MAAAMLEVAVVVASSCAGTDDAVARTTPPPPPPPPLPRSTVFCFGLCANSLLKRVNLSIGDLPSTLTPAQCANRPPPSPLPRPDSTPSCTCLGRPPPSQVASTAAAAAALTTARPPAASPRHRWKVPSCQHRHKRRPTASGSSRPQSSLALPLFTLPASRLLPRCPAPPVTVHSPSSSASTPPPPAPTLPIPRHRSRRARLSRPAYRSHSSLPAAWEARRGSFRDFNHDCTPAAHPSPTTARTPALARSHSVSASFLRAGLNAGRSTQSLLRLCHSPPAIGAARVPRQRPFEQPAHA